MEKAIQETRAHIAHIGKLLYERRLTDTGGGNISVRVGEVLCMSPAYAGSKRQWQLQPEQVLVVDLKTRTLLDGDGKISREANVHFRLHEEFADAGTAVIHCHAQNVMVFAAVAKPMPPVLEANLKFGEAKVIPYAPAHSQQLAENVVAGIRGQEERIRKHAAGVIAPWHGLFLMGRDLDAALDGVERFDTNARCIILGQQLLGTNDMLAEQRRNLSTAVEAFKAKD